MNVSRETQERLDIYLELLKKWSPKINLVSSASLKDAASRHFLDSLQIAELGNPQAKTWADLGSGGGFPGAVVAIVMAEFHQDFEMTLVESDQRKAAFLRTVSRETNTDISVVAKRIEDINPLDVEVVSARALAPLSDLLAYVDIHSQPDGIAIFPKGANWKSEVTEAQKTWRFSLKTHTSKTNPNAAVLEIGDLSRV